MPEHPLPLIRRVMQEQYGIADLSDDELHAVVNAKLAGMDPLERAAFYMRLGEAAGPEATVHKGYKIAAYLLLALIAWFVYRPAAALIVILSLGNIRPWAIRHSPFWSPSGAIAIGFVYGAAVAVLVRITQIAIVSSLTARLGFGVLGFMASGYFGYGTHPLDLSSERRTTASATAIITYAFALLASVVMDVVLGR